MIEERIQVAKQYVKTLFADRADGHDVEHKMCIRDRGHTGNQCFPSTHS